MPYFLNPYHFVDASEFTPRYAHTPRDRFNFFSGKMTVFLDLKAPSFLPDPDATEYWITDETLTTEEEESRRTLLHDTLLQFLNTHQIGFSELPKPIFFDPDSRHWKPQSPEKHVVLLDSTTVEIPADWCAGVIQEFSNGRENHRLGLKTEKPHRFAHKQMGFYRVNGRPALPATSLKGMLRNAIESLSNSCFPGYEENNTAEYLFHRLDVEKADRRSIQVTPVVIVRLNETWGAVKLDSAKILSPNIINRSHSSGENLLSAYWNATDGCYEKIGLRGNNDRRQPKGLFAYLTSKERDRRGEIHEITDMAIDRFSIRRINENELNHPRNATNKTFTYISQIKPPKPLYAIIRRKMIPTRRGNRFPVYKIKMVSADFQVLQNNIEAFRQSEGNQQDVDYQITEIRIKTAFDIDTKTQYQAFFIYGQTDFDSAVSWEIQKNQFIQLSPENLDRFRCLLRQRKENARKLAEDLAGINDAEEKQMPENVFSGMLAYYQMNDQYLTYTMVPQRSYRNWPRQLIGNEDKAPCQKLNQLCPACQLFGSASLSDADGNTTIGAAKGKVAIGIGRLKHQAGSTRNVRLKSLGEPKPTYYPFYLLNNRGSSRQLTDYDNRHARIGRKIYLHHHPDFRTFESDQMSNLNATVELMPENTRFAFDINFTNLTAYELGLLLYSLDMAYKGNKTAQHIGMGKSRGLGTCVLNRQAVFLYDMAEHYRNFQNDGVQIRDQYIETLKNLYRYAQGASNPEEFQQRLSQYMHIQMPDDIGKVELPETAEIDRQFFSRRHIHEYHFLSSLNIHPAFHLPYPVAYAPGWEKGFEWYQQARRHNAERGLFDPVQMEAALEGNRNTADAALPVQP